MPVTISVNFRSSRSPTSGENQRAVPRRVTVSGMTLKVWPPSMWPMVMTPASTGSRFRATTDCRAVTIWAAITTGSLPWCGMAPCAPVPAMVASRFATAAMIGPSRQMKTPSGAPGQLCMPKTRSIGKRSNSPSCTITWPPPRFSSAGWKMT
jgi:hypothetical protein